MLTDLRYTIRQLRKSPGFTIAAVVTLALAIGANTVIYQLIDAVMFRPLPVHEPERLVRIDLVENGTPRPFSYPMYRELVARQQVADSLFAVAEYPLHAAVLRGRGGNRIVNAVLVTSSYFDVLGLHAQAGRLFAPQLDQPTAVISDRFWSREFRRSADAVGQSLVINRQPVTIIGIAPRGFSGERQGNTPDLWLPMEHAPLFTATDWLDAPKSSWLTVAGRLPPGISIERAEAALQTVLAPARIQLHTAARGVTTLQGSFESPLLILMTVSGTILLIACCNLANLMLGRAAARTHEMAIRLALGSGRARLIRQLLTEAALLSFLGTLAALAVGRWGAVALASLVDHDRFEPSSDWRVVGAALATTVLSTCLFGLVPAVVSTGASLRGAMQRRPRRAFRGALVVAQVSLSLLLLSGAGMLMRSLWNLRYQDFGFRAGQALIADLPWEFSPTMMARYAALAGPLEDRLRALPGVRSAAIAGFGPLGGDQHTGPLAAPARPAQPGDNNRIVHAGTGYFAAMGIDIVQGRPFTADDRAGAPAVAILSETAARQIFGGASAVGRLVSQASPYDARRAIEVVGVARDVRFAGPSDPFGFLLYLPMAQSPAPITAVVVRAAGDPASVAANVRAVLDDLDPELAVGGIRPIADKIDGMLLRERSTALLSTCFGVLALGLTAIGIYGVISYGVEQRTREIGIRIALGARGAQVSTMLLKELATLAVLSAVLGGAGAVVAAHALRGMLFGIGPNDYWSVLLAGVLLGAVAAAAAWLPARRAARIEPMDALRQE